MNVPFLEQRRDAAFFVIIRELNDRNEHWSHLVDCGELGFVIVEWRTRWSAWWFDKAEKLADFTGEKPPENRKEREKCLSDHNQSVR